MIGNKVTRLNRWGQRTTGIGEEGNLADAMQIELPSQTFDCYCAVLIVPVRQQPKAFLSFSDEPMTGEIDEQAVYWRCSCLKDFIKFLAQSRNRDRSRF